MIRKLVTPLRLQRLAQVVFLTGLMAAAILMLGPFSGLEERLGLTDKAAHIIAFYALTVSLFLSAPRRRRLDLAMGVLSFGILIELLQSQVGRSMSLSDLAADAVGVTAAVLPGVIERLRFHVRTAPDTSFEAIAAADPRRAARAEARRRVQIYSQ